MDEPLANEKPRGRLCFDRFELDLGTGDLFADDKRIPLAPQPLAVLRVLVERSGETVTREALRASVWGAERHLQFEQSLNSCMRRLRAALEDDPQAPRFIETVPRRGYRFVAPVTASGPRAPKVGVRASGRRRRWWIALAALAVSVTLALYASRRPAEEPVIPPLADGAVAPTVLAVLPFEDRMPDASWRFLASELAADLRQRLAASAPGRLRVLGTATADALARGDLSIAPLLIRGALEHEGTVSRLRIEHLDAQGAMTWETAASWSGEIEVAAAERALDEVAAALAVHLLGEPTFPSLTNDVASPAAREAFLRGRYQMRQGGRENLERAVASFEQATEADPTDARAWAELARARSSMAWPGGSPDEERIAAARQAAERALAVDPQSVEALLAHGFLALYYDSRGRFVGRRWPPYRPV